MLSFTLLGQTVLTKDGAPLVNFRSQKEAALLIYLAHTGQAHQREFIAELLWDATTTKQALSNLRTVLTRLRKQVGDSLLVTRKTLALTDENYKQVDSRRLLDTLNRHKTIRSNEDAQALQNALDLYQDDFLADFYLADAPRFEEWAVTTREHIRQQVIIACDRLGQYAVANENTAQGIAISRRWLEIDPYDETAHTLLVSLLLKNGQTREAMVHYDQTATLLQTELGIAPPAEMTALIDEARPKPIAVPAQPATVRHNLPAEHDQFFGRQAVQEEIHVRLDQPWCRLVTITGPGGVGKTRLATNIARHRLSQYPDGVWLIELAELDSNDDDVAEAIAVEIATVLDLRLSGSKTPIAQVIDHLQHKKILLMLDNFEHLLGGVQAVLDMVQACDTLQLLVTSREALQLRAEWTIGLVGLTYPANGDDEAESEAMSLFVARHAQQRHGDIKPDVLAAIREICRLVEGFPLAIELAAALTRQASCQAVAERLRDGFEALNSTLRDVPFRHHSLHVVFEMSWETLMPELQARLARLSVFRGGFTAVSAKQIASASLVHLAALGDKSLLAYDEPTGRYVLHAVVRAYAAKKRADDDKTVGKHGRYFLNLLAQHTDPLQKDAPQESIEQIKPDIDNVRRAWQTGLDKKMPALLLDALTSLSIYFQLRGLSHEGEATMQTTVRTATAWEADGTPLAIRAGLECARFQNRLGQYRAAIQTVKTALALAEQSQDRWAEGMGHVWWGESLWRLGEYQQAETKLNHALDIAQAIDSIELTGWCHHQLGIINDIQSRYDTAHDHLEKACAAWEMLGNAQALSNSLNSIGLVNYHQDDLPAAQEVMEQALTLCNQLGNRHVEAALLNNLSIVSTQQEDYTGAQYYLQLSLQLATLNGDLTRLGEIYANLGRNYRFLGESALAIESLERGLEISESIGNRNSITGTMIELADVEKKRGKIERAESLYNQALIIARQDRLQRFELEALIGMVELSQKYDKSKASKFSLEAIELAEALQSPTLLKRAQTVNSQLETSQDINEKNLPK